jgi:LacI family transcriptional regulator
MNKKVSLKDIAEQLGVSTALVSYVLNNKERKARVGDEMARKIRQLATTLNYQPNIIARSLQSGKSNTIAVVVADISNPFFSSIARIIEDEAMRHDYVVFFGSSDENAERSRRLIDVFINRGVDAFIIAPSENTEKQIQRLVKQQIPLVLIDRYFPGLKSDYVVINNFQAAYNATEHLIQGGRGRIAMMAYDTNMKHMQERIRGYQAALENNGIPFDESWLMTVSYQDLSSQISQTIKNIATPPIRIDGFIFATNSLAVLSLKTLTSLGVRIPDDLSVVSFDESDAFDLFYPPVSYVSQSLYDIGKSAVELAMSRIRGENKTPKHIVIDAKLVVRESSAAKAQKKHV